MTNVKKTTTRMMLIALFLVVLAVPAYGQSAIEFAETCDEASGQCAYWETLAPNTCEEPAPEELVCSEDNQESPERGDALPIYQIGN